MPKAKILLIEDDRSLAGALDYNLRQAGYDVNCATDGQDGLNQARLKSPDLILLDVMIPVVDGFEVCRRLKGSRDTSEIPVIFLTAKGEEIDQIVGYNVGADDYVTKPFSVKVLLERIKTLLRRQYRTGDQSGDTVSHAGIMVDRIKHKILLDGKPLNVTPSEFRLLDTLVRHPGRAFDRAELIDAALGADTLVLERTIDVHIRALRKKLGNASNLIETVRGIGYRFCDTPADENGN